MSKIKALDTNVFIHAILQAKSDLSEAEMRVKQNSMNILTRVQKGEVVQVTTLQIAEIMNLLERWEGHEIARNIFQFLLEAPNVRVFEITQNELNDVLDLAEQYKHNKIGVNDLVTYAAMKESSINEIYSFDRHFDQFPDINRLEE